MLTNFDCQILSNLDAYYLPILIIKCFLILIANYRLGEMEYVIGRTFLSFFLGGELGGRVCI